MSLIEKLRCANKKFTEDLHKKFDGEFEAMCESVNIDKYLPIIPITIHLTRIENCPEKIVEFANLLEEMVDRRLYYGAVVEEIAYNISLELSEYIEKYLDVLDDGYVFSEVFDGNTVEDEIKRAFDGSSKQPTSKWATKNPKKAPTPQSLEECITCKKPFDEATMIIDVEGFICRGCICTCTKCDGITRRVNSKGWCDACIAKVAVTLSSIRQTYDEEEGDEKIVSKYICTKFGDKGFSSEKKARAFVYKLADKYIYEVIGYGGVIAVVNKKLMRKMFLAATKKE